MSLPYMFNLQPIIGLVGFLYVRYFIFFSYIYIFHSELEDTEFCNLVLVLSAWLQATEFYKKMKFLLNFPVQLDLSIML